MAIAESAKTAETYRIFTGLPILVTPVDATLVAGCEASACYRRGKPVLPWKHDKSKEPGVFPVQRLQARALKASVISKARALAHSLAWGPTPFGCRRAPFYIGGAVLGLWIAVTVAVRVLSCVGRDRSNRRAPSAAPKRPAP